MYTVKRQQAYFTARSAISILLEEFTSQEQIREEVIQDPSGRIVNFDGNYIIDGNVCRPDNSIIYSSSEITEDGYLIVNGKATGKLVRRPQMFSGQYTPESEISILPVPNGEVEITDFGFDPKMGTATATISRNDDDEVKIVVNSIYADQKYKMEATVVRQPLYFGGIAIRKLSLGANLILGKNTDFYWNNTSLFDPSIADSTYITNPGNYKLTINGNFVSKGDARIPAGTIVAGRRFTGAANFTNDGLHTKKIWSPSEYIISNKTLLVGDTNTEYTTNFLNQLANIMTTRRKYCNSAREDQFGGILGNPNLINWLNMVGLGDIYEDIVTETLSLTNTAGSALAIQYIDIKPWGLEIEGMNTRFKYMDVSYIDYTSGDVTSYSDEVVPLVYLFARDGSTLRIRYGSKPEKASQIGQAYENAINNVGAFFDSVFNMTRKPNYNVVYLEPNSTIHLGYDNDNNRRADCKPSDLVFMYSIFGDETTTVVLHRGVIFVGEIMCGNLIIDSVGNGTGDVKIIYSSTSGSQVAKQRIAEYWAVSNYSD
jgi:hypothetical protein